MDIELISSFKPLIFLAITIPLTLFLLKLGRSRRPRLPPGPWKLPVMGNLHQLSLGLSPQTLRELAKKHGPLMHLQLGEVSIVVASSPETVKQVMKTHDMCFASRPQSSVPLGILTYGFTDIVNSPYGDYWRELRKICTLEFLTVKRVQSFRPVREEEFSDLVDWIKENSGSEINITQKVKSSLMRIISGTAFGRKIKEHETFVALLSEALRLCEGLDVSDAFPSIKFLHHIKGVQPKMERIRAQIDTILESIIQQQIEIRSSDVRDEHKYEGLLDVLLKYREKDAGFSLTTDNIKGVLLDLYSGGGWTSMTTISCAMTEMLKNRNILEKVQDEVRKVFNSKGYVDEANLPELKYLEAVVKETLRLHPPEPLLLQRECVKPCNINGYDVPLKTRILVNAWAVARDPGYWEDAEGFKPERFLDSPVDYKGNNFEYVPFGAGRRICPGIYSGVVNVELALANFLYHFNWELPGGTTSEELDMPEARDLYVIPSVYGRK